MLRAGEISWWHRVDAVEIWHWYEGAPLELRVAKALDDVTVTVLGRPGPEDAGGATVLPQVVVPANAWQSARSLGQYSLVGCTVAPGFTFAGFELAPRDWSPGQAI